MVIKLKAKTPSIQRIIDLHGPLWNVLEELGNDVLRVEPLNPRVHGNLKWETLIVLNRDAELVERVRPGEY